MPENQMSSQELAALTVLPAVARNINMPCKKCGVDRFFVVVAHTSATSAKCKCEVCGATKTFKLGKADKPKKTASGVKKTPKTRGPDHQAVWNELKVQIGTDKILPYSMKAKFNLANAINHPKFGIGFVTNATHDKIDVAFAEGGRALVHNRP
jgi:hypothetical protein